MICHARRVCLISKWRLTFFIQARSRGDQIEIFVINDLIDAGLIVFFKNSLKSELRSEQINYI